VTKATSIITAAMISDVPVGFYEGQELKRDLSFRNLKSENW
jgi:hypothetical protein